MSLDKINKNQIKLLKDCKKFILKEKNKNIDICASPLCFFTVWALTPGYYKAFDLYGKKQNSKILFTIKNLLSIAKNFDLKLHLNEQSINNTAENLIISYASKRSFNIKGDFVDSYFNLKANDPNFFWLLISLDDYIPKKIQSNVAIIAKEKIKSFSLIYMFKYLSKLIIDSNFNINLLKHFCWKEFNVSNIFFEKLQYLVSTIKIKNLILNYENIPYQNYIVKELKKMNKKINTIGYLHCAPWPIQLDLIYKDQPLDRLIVSGYQQKNVLKKYLGWSKKKIDVIPSLRFHKKRSKEFNGYIFVPYNLHRNNDYLKRLEHYFDRKKGKNIFHFKVRIHPLNSSSKAHLEFKKKCEQLLKKYSKEKNKICNESLFLGSATGVCIQALEEGTKITHFPNDENLDVFSPIIWKTIDTKKVGEKIYSYKLKKKNYTFLANYEKNKFKKYFRPILK